MSISVWRDVAEISIGQSDCPNHTERLRRCCRTHAVGMMIATTCDSRFSLLLLMQETVKAGDSVEAVL
jgi:hypothetical protein